MEQQNAREEVWRLIKRGYYDSAISLIKKELATDEAFINEIAGWFVDRGEWVIFHGYEHLLRAYAMVPLGLPRAIRERLLTAFVKWGFHEHAECLAEGLGRSLTMDEVRMLVKTYADGCLQSDRIEAELTLLAWEVGGELLESRVRRDIATMHVRWQREGLLY